MTENQIREIENQLPEGETINRAYRAMEGDIRVISRDREGCEYRYRVSFNADDSVSIKRF